MTFTLPDPDLQVAFSEQLVAARTEFLQPALLQAARACRIEDLDRDAHRYVPALSLQQLAGRGLRAEAVFALPTLLRQNPRLLGYYRLLLGYSQKAFYRASTGLSAWKRIEDGKALTQAQDADIPDLCRELNRSASLLVARLEAILTLEHLDSLSLLTYGPQLRGRQNVLIGQWAIAEVFKVIRGLIGEHATDVKEKRIRYTAATGRAMEVQFGSDPDISVYSLTSTRPLRRDPVLAIEVKGGTDASNAHNRLGEAEKSHNKARNKGFTDLWTIVNTRDLSPGTMRSESPSTSRFFDLAHIVARQGEEYEDFRERLLQKFSLPAV
jgi:hypothetical protein